MGVWSAAAIALALAPGAAAQLSLDADGLDWRAALDAEDLAVPLPAIAAPNAVTLTLDGADALGLSLGTHDADGFTLAPAPGAPVALPVLWFPGLTDERAVYPLWLLAFEEDTAAGADEALLTVYDLFDNAAALGGIQPPDRLDGDPAETLPRMLLGVDAAGLAFFTEFHVHPEAAQAQGAEVRPAPGEGLPGLVRAEGLPGLAPALGTALGPDGADAAWALPAPVEAAPAPVAGPAATLAPASVAPAPPLARDGTVLVLGVATGLLLGGIALYHLVNRNNIFENDVRMQVYDVVARNPGVTIQEVARVVGLSHPTARYHLNVLAKNDLVVFLDKGNKMMFFRNRNEFSEQEREVVAILRNPEAMRVYACIEQSPWILRKELSERLGISRTSVNWHLRNLMRAHLVAETREQGKGFLFVRREGREALLRVQGRVPAGAPQAAAAPSPPAEPAPAPAGSAVSAPGRELAV